MHTIQKYELKPFYSQYISMHEGAKPLSVQYQENTLCLWAMVDTSKPIVSYIINVFETGSVIQDYQTETYLGTIEKDGYVRHIFFNRK